MKATVLTALLATSTADARGVFFKKSMYDCEGDERQGYCCVDGDCCYDNNPDQCVPEAFLPPGLFKKADEIDDAAQGCFDFCEYSNYDDCWSMCMDNHLKKAGIDEEESQCFEFCNDIEDLDEHH